METPRAISAEIDDEGPFRELDQEEESSIDGENDNSDPEDVLENSDHGTNSEQSFDETAQPSTASADGTV